MFNLDEFIAKEVIKRDKSMFDQDLENHFDFLKSQIHGKKILIIGGAGSIGSAFIKETLVFQPSGLVIVDTDENGLTEITRDLRSGIYAESVPAEYITYPMDYSSEAFKKMVKKKGGFDIVANFAAHKHVRSEKDIFSLEALFYNNVLNIINLMELLSEYPPDEYFCVSTDKAANPVNVMGASKRMMEDLVFSYSNRFSVKTARFANVAFSKGSLPDGFLQRINKQQPLSAPYDVKRYFVSQKESGQICLASCLLGNNREIVFPKLKDEQMESFDHIAERLLDYLGYEIDYCKSEEEAKSKASFLKNGTTNKYPVYFSHSDTSGEKQYEEFYTNDERVSLNRFQSLGVIIDKKMPDRMKLMSTLSLIKREFEEGTDKEKIISIISGYLGAFNHLERNKGLDDSM